MITKQDILEALGAESARDKFMTGLLVGIGLGALVGGAMAMLWAPKSGAELREDLGERGRKLYEKARGLKERAMEKASEVSSENLT